MTKKIPHLQMTELLIFTERRVLSDDDKWKSSREQAANAHVKHLRELNWFKY